MCSTERGQRCMGITFSQQDGTGRLSGKCVEIRGLELCRDSGKLIGGRPRASDVFSFQ